MNKKNKNAELEMATAQNSGAEAPHCNRTPSSPTEGKNRGNRKTKKKSSPQAAPQNQRRVPEGSVQRLVGPVLVLEKPMNLISHSERIKKNADQILSGIFHALTLGLLRKVVKFQLLSGRSPLLQAHTHRLAEQTSDT